MQQEVVLALLAKEPSHGYQLRGRLRDALGPLGDGRRRRAATLRLPRSSDGAGRLLLRSCAASEPKSAASARCSPRGLQRRWSGPELW